MLAAHIEHSYVKRHSPWGDIYDVPSLRADNDNQPPRPLDRPQMIGLTGKRNVGKSTVARLLEREFYFTAVHPIAAVKEGARYYFEALGIDSEDAWEMVYGDLKDVPSEYLPDNSTPRFYLEKIGRFHFDLGIDWTLGVGIDAARRANPGRRIVVESLVYEADWFRARGGMVVRLDRPGHDGPEGVESDAAQAAVRADVTIVAGTVEELEGEARKLVQQVFGGG